MNCGQKIIRELNGHSGSKIYLMESENLFVRKIGNVERNNERLTELNKNGYNVPCIYRKENDILDMEYIHGLDMVNYLKSNNIKNLADFILGTLHKFSIGSVDKDYTEVYNEKLDWVNSDDDLPFTKDELISRLPKYLPQSMYHGDMTLENLLYTDDGFVMIDAMTTEYDSYIFDIAKMRQDLECKWFLRFNNIKLDVKLKKLQDIILEQFPLSNNNYLLILMLLRVYCHTEKNDFNYKFIMKEIQRLWK